MSESGTINPYEAPQAPLAEDPGPTKWFRWQVVPASVCGLFSLLTVLNALSWSPFSPEVPILYGLSSILWGVSAVLWIKFRWWVAVIIAGIAYYLPPVIQA